MPKRDVYVIIVKKTAKTNQISDATIANWLLGVLGVLFAILVLGGAEHFSEVVLPVLFFTTLFCGAVAAVANFLGIKF